MWRRGRTKKENDQVTCGGSWSSQVGFAWLHEVGTLSKGAPGLKALRGRGLLGGGRTKGGRTTSHSRGSGGMQKQPPNAQLQLHHRYPTTNNSEFECKSACRPPQVNNAKYSGIYS